MGIESSKSRITPRLHAELAGGLMKNDGMIRLGSKILESWTGRPKRRNSVLL